MRPSRLGCIRFSVALQVRRFRADVRGVTAIEFGMVAAPFFIFLMGIMTLGTQYLTSHFLEYGAEVAARKLRTGEAQKAGLTLAQFRTLYCNSVGFMVDCDAHLLKIHINSSQRFADLPQVNCMTSGGDLAEPPGNPGDNIRTRAGDASNAVKVNICYDWQVGVAFWKTLWAVLNPDHAVADKLVLSTATAFRSEPYE
ncbi:TadE/TadG family type IV pilus assembly protein [uncultured Hyphomicrobium sp.]|uniref:TadE/TadG family type IV pilus assembly protein n=1 Tax=uncultured Hyphomicrobium sp. TaxID=194373 RepID=UPI00260151E5|nr:TadE/TadG family type IV pilus assembly protein [uncultured Hyphomicrobium sp.]